MSKSNVITIELLEVQKNDIDIDTNIFIGRFAGMSILYAYGRLWVNVKGGEEV